MDKVTLNAWSKLPFHDPETVLRKLRQVELGLVGAVIDDDVRTLRTNQLKAHRESRDAAIFSYGMGSALNTKVLMAREQSSDYDFVTCWSSADTLNYCPVQLKELPPAHLNATITVASLLAGLTRFSPAKDTVLAVKVNRDGRFDFPTIARGSVPFSQLWFFGGTSADQSEWFLYGDVLSDPRLVPFRYPS